MLQGKSLKLIFASVAALLAVAPAMASGPMSGITRLDADLNAFASGSFTGSSFFSGSELSFSSELASAFEGSPFFTDSSFTSSFAQSSVFASPSSAFTAPAIDLRWTANATSPSDFAADSQFSEFAAPSAFSDSQFSGFAASSGVTSSEFSGFAGSEFDGTAFTQSGWASPIELISP